MALVAVYNYVIFNSDNHKDIIGVKMATAETIKRINANMNLSSKKEVEDSEIDPEGFYPKGPVVPVG